jgi:hypothetical protein
MIILDVNSLVAYRQAKGRKSIFGVYDEFSAYGDRRIVDIVNKSRSAASNVLFLLKHYLILML